MSNCAFQHPGSADRLKSATIVDALNDMEGRPWPGWSRGKGLSAHTLARQLAPFKIRPRTIKFGTSTAKGYMLEHLEDTFARYLGESNRNHRNDVENHSGNHESPTVTSAEQVTFPSGENHNNIKDSYGVTVSAPEGKVEMEV